VRKRRTSVSQGTGASREDRAAGEELVPLTNAIVWINLADDRQMMVVTDHILLAELGCQRASALPRTLTDRACHDVLQLH
jgi:hypothetical protein